MESKLRTEKDIKDVFFLLMLFFLLLLMMFMMPFGEGPDERMRYQVPEYIYKYLELPRGDNPEIMNETWGISYAFTPINSYIIAAFFMRIASVFSKSEEVLVYSARMVSIMFAMGTAIFCIKIGKKLFKGIYIWLFVVLVTLLPEFIFVSGYVNCDSLAIFSTAWIIYGVVYGKERCWSLRSCLFLGTGIGVCALSYYNAYGVILFAILYCVLNVILDKNIEDKVRFILVRIFWVSGSVFVVAGWWFIRNGLIYKGDILGTRASRECGEIHAIDELKPSKRSTPYRNGYSLKYMLFNMQWLKSSMDSFVVAFGPMRYFIEDIYYKIYYSMISIGLVCNMLGAVTVIMKKAKEKREKILKNKAIALNNQEDGLVRDCLFLLCMCGMCIITIGLSVYNSYYNDFQAQGRYCLPMLVPLAILITKGINNIGIYINDLLGKVLSYIMCLYMFYLSFYSIFCMMISQYQY